MPKPVIWLIDTSVFTNILDLDGWNQQRKEVMVDFEAKIEAGDGFMVPFTTILETGNFIHQMPKKGLRQTVAQRFEAYISASLQGNTPWRILDFPNPTDLSEWLRQYVTQVDVMGLGDHMIVEQWKQQCAAIPGYSIRIWSLDAHLLGYEGDH